MNARRHHDVLSRQRLAVSDRLRLPVRLVAGGGDLTGDRRQKVGGIVDIRLRGTADIDRGRGIGDRRRLALTAAGLHRLVGDAVDRGLRLHHASGAGVGEAVGIDGIIVSGRRQQADIVGACLDLFVIGVGGNQRRRRLTGGCHHLPLQAAELVIGKRRHGAAGIGLADQPVGAVIGRRPVAEIRIGSRKPVAVKVLGAGPHRSLRIAHLEQPAHHL
ncbi:hypothetical protein [Rhizobium mongolense]|uniref:hypothetical protein n=1 Tax=Rhizobium mongolense TaxID=57676 RepID=UPI003F5E8D1D